MFALDRTNHRQWLPVHIRGMAELPHKHPHVYKEFTSGGKFAVQKTTDTSSCIPLDRGHEQNNKLIKGYGVATRKTDGFTAYYNLTNGTPVDGTQSHFVIFNKRGIFIFVAMAMHI